MSSICQVADDGNFSVVHRAVDCIPRQPFTQPQKRPSSTVPVPPSQVTVPGPRSVGSM
jgi:hypothetical protein